MPCKNRRTLQYAPAVDDETVKEAAESDADAVILDLESTIDESRKSEARANLASLLSEIDFQGKEIIVRINDLRSSYWLADLEAAITAGADTIRLPKIEESQEVITAVETANQLTEDEPEFLLQLESPQGVLNGDEIAEACSELPQVTGIGIGIGDYTKSLGLNSHTSDLRSFLLNRTAAYASIGNMDALGYVHKDLDTLRQAAKQAKACGHVGQPIAVTDNHDEFISILNEVY
jgi:citrate lyase subunit beta/citryl-CoA lyase